MQAIQTTYKGPTNHRGARIIAKCSAAAKAFSVEDLDQNDGEHGHKDAALKLADKLGWLDDRYRNMIGGQLIDGSYAWILVSTGDKIITGTVK